MKISSGLAFLHLNFIAHRDVKSSNVLVTGEECVRGEGHAQAQLEEGEKEAGSSSSSLT